MSYSIHIPGLVEAIATSKPTAKHEALLETMHSQADCTNAKLVTSRGGAYLGRRKVVTARGDLVHVDHEVWLQTQADADSGNLPATLRRLKDLDYRLTECEITTLYVVHDTGRGQDDFIQFTVLQEDEFIVRRLFSPFGHGWWREPRDFDDLRQASEEGERLDGDARRRFRLTEYRLRATVESGV